MKTFKAIMYDIGIIAATIVSMLLMISLVANTVLSCSSSFLKKDNVEEMIESIDYSEFIMAEIEGSTDGNIQGLDNEVIEEILKTEMVDEILELCVESIYAEFEGKGSKGELSLKEIKRIGNKYSDEIEDLLKEHYEKSSTMSDEKIEQIVDNLIEKYAETIVEMAPTAETLGLSQESIDTVASVQNGTYFWISCGVTAVLTLIIFLILLSKFKGLLWIGIDYFIVATGILVTSFSVESIVNALSEGTILKSLDITSVTDSISGSMMISSIVMYVLSVVFIVLFIVTKVIKKKKLAKKEKNQKVEVLPVTEVPNEGI